jgi:hypothetical protein
MAAANQRDGQITSDFQKSCQALKSKIFLFSPDPNQNRADKTLIRKRRWQQSLVTEESAK